MKPYDAQCNRTQDIPWISASLFPSSPSKLTSSCLAARMVTSSGWGRAPTRSGSQNASEAVPGHGQLRCHPYHHDHCQHGNGMNEALRWVHAWRQAARCSRNSVAGPYHLYDLVSGVWILMRHDEAVIDCGRLWGKGTVQNQRGLDQWEAETNVEHRLLSTHCMGTQSTEPWSM